VGLRDRRNIGATRMTAVAQRFVDLDPGHPELEEGLALLQQLRPNRSLAELRRLFLEGYRDSGYRLTALFVEGRPHAVAGYRTLTNVAAGRHVYVDDLVTLPEARSNGYGAELLTYIADHARALGCSQLILDSGTHRIEAHRFYFREGLTITDFHFRRELESA
jgi:GNAT superfamily N-acetyltransferase